MPDFQRITIENIEYFIVDSIQNLRAEDSFIHRNNKLSVFGGNGEARKYVGSYIDDSGRKLSTFFEYENWGITETKNGRRVEYPFIQKNCFFIRKIYSVIWLMQKLNITNKNRNIIMIFQGFMMITF
ncbi:type II restriction endonuclease [Neisseria meningitidis]|nr:type II restriction endonuclease [Neisseria meningitidis]CWR41216.1 type II restriction endonuclease [Neisseria meningitidis]